MKKLSFKEQIIISAILLLLYTCICLTFTCFITNHIMVMLLSLIIILLRFFLLVKSILIKSNNKLFVLLSFIFTIFFAILYFKTINIIYVYVFLEIIPIISLIYILNKKKPLLFNRVLKHYSDKNISVSIYIKSESFLDYINKHKYALETFSKSNIIHIFISTTFNNCSLIDDYIDNDNIIVTITNYDMKERKDSMMIVNNILQHKYFVYCKNELFHK